MMQVHIQGIMNYMLDNKTSSYPGALYHTLRRLNKIGNFSTSIDPLKLNSTCVKQINTVKTDLMRKKKKEITERVRKNPSLSFKSLEQK